MKKFTALLLTSVLALGLTACGAGGNQTAPTQATKESTPANNEKASNYPEKPITVVAPSGAGGGWDKTARSLTKILAETKLVDKTMTVENKPGGGGAVFLAEYVNQDKKNPYKLFVSSPPILINNNKKEGNSPFGYRDTIPLAQLTRDYGAIVVKADSPFQDLKSALDAIKADPTKVTVAGGSAPGSMDHLIAVLPAFKYGVDPKAVKYVSYDGGGEAIAALLGGNADFIATDASAVGEYLKAGKIRVLAVSSTERLGGELKDIPTFKEAGVEAEFTIWRGVFGPKEMPEDALKFWEESLKALSEKEEWKKELEANGWQSEYKNSKDFRAFLDEQDQLVKEVLAALDMAK
ncbi:tripartite tricarboxylate transporter substrate binding protein [Ammoniphilus sp. YIM 78166]|uniref:tripartite tricarboxylate transporter substrate binding protein n=1 Tax=Ammoniphilus sp. YIM 78166 TaxID=1644106 RepID=UPI00106F40D8|nr:tripartite tricarboxylate transporter substrate binding protein [Ammoniphilus sp. YIM 78166]